MEDLKLAGVNLGPEHEVTIVPWPRSHLLTVKPQFLCFCHVSAVAVALCTFLALSYRLLRSLWSRAPDTGSWRKSREWFWMAFVSLPMDVTWCDGGNLIAVAAILFALSIFCLPCPSICQGFAPYIFSTAEHSAGCQCIAIFSLSHEGCFDQSISPRKEVFHACRISKLIKR